MPPGAGHGQVVLPATAAGRLIELVACNTDSLIGFIVTSVTSESNVIVCSRRRSILESDCILRGSRKLFRAASARDVEEEQALCKGDPELICSSADFSYGCIAWQTRWKA
jgi:hypothetical protein